jgi:hypothetical protein
LCFFFPQNFCFSRLGSDGFFLNLMVTSSSQLQLSQKGNF